MKIELTETETRMVVNELRNAARMQTKYAQLCAILANKIENSERENSERETEELENNVPGLIRTKNGMAKYDQDTRCWLVYLNNSYLHPYIAGSEASAKQILASEYFNRSNHFKTS